MITANRPPGELRFEGLLVSSEQVGSKGTMSQKQAPSAPTLQSLMRRLAQHEPDITEEIEVTHLSGTCTGGVGWPIQRRRGSDCEWQEGSQRLVRALHAFRDWHPHLDWEDYADFGGRGRYTGSIAPGVAKSF